MSPGDCACVRAGIYTPAFALAALGCVCAGWPEHMGPIAGGTKRAGTAIGTQHRGVPARGRPPARLVKEGVQPAVLLLSSKETKP